MRKMKDSGVAWIGEIPATWTLSKIGSLYTQRNEKVSDKDFAPLSVTMKGIVPQLETAAKTEDGDNRKLVRKGDFAINSRSDRRGSCGISAYDGSVSLINIILMPRGEMHPGYYDWLFHTSLFADEFYKWGHGIVDDLWTTRWQEMKAICVPVPPYHDQERISSFLNGKCAEIDAILEKTRTSIKEYKKLKQAIITQAITKGIRGNRLMKESGIGGIDSIPADWSVQRFSYLATVKCNLVPPQEYLDYPQVSPENIEKGSGKLLPCKTVRDSGVISGNHLFFEGQILYSKIRPKLNKVCIAPFSGLCSADMYPIETEHNTKFIVYYMRSDAFLNQVSMITEDRVKMPKINQNELGSILVATPPEESEQAEIVKYLDQRCAEIDGLISQKEQLLYELDGYKKSLIYEYVTGKKEVQKEQQVKKVIIPFFPAVFQASNPRFAQAILMSKVLDSCRIKMGRVKLEKMMFVLENSIGFDFNTEYEREAAGPFDRSIYECEKIISRKNKWFTIRESQYGVSYKPTTEYSKYKKYFAQYFGGYEDAIDKVIAIFNDFDADQAEVIATLYGAWNDFIIDKCSYTDGDIVDQVLNHWHPKKRRFPKDMWLRAIQKMRDFDLVPQGYGRHTVIKEKNYG